MPSAGVPKNKEPLKKPFIICIYTYKDYYMTVIWFLYEHYMTFTWNVYEFYMICTLRLHDFYIILYKCFMICTCCLYMIIYMILYEF